LDVGGVDGNKARAPSGNGIGEGKDVELLIGAELLGDDSVQLAGDERQARVSAAAVLEGGGHAARDINDELDALLNNRSKDAGTRKQSQ